MKHNQVTAYNANTQMWKDRMASVRIVYGVETNAAGGKDAQHGSDEIISEPGHKERFDAVFRSMVPRAKLPKPKKR